MYPTTHTLAIFRYPGTFRVYPGTFRAYPGTFRAYFLLNIPWQPSGFGVQGVLFFCLRAGGRGGGEGGGERGGRRSKPGFLNTNPASIAQSVSPPLAPPAPAIKARPAVSPDGMRDTHTWDTVHSTWDAYGTILYTCTGHGEMGFRDVGCGIPA